MPKVVFLDRDDTLIEANSLPPPPPPAAPGDLVDPSLVTLRPGAEESCHRLKRAGFLLIVISNQGVIARGGGAIGQVQLVNRRIADLLPIDAFFFCPFHPRGSVPAFSREHHWRKPQPGMLLAAAHEFRINLAASWLIGDATRDIEAGIAAGIDRARCLLLGRDVPDLTRAADRILTG